MIDVDCANTPILMEPGVTVARGLASSSRDVPNQRYVYARGKYDLIFYVLSQVEIDRLFWTSEGSYPGRYRVEAEEQVCTEHTFGQGC